MVAELPLCNKPDHVHSLSYQARELSTPRFARPVEVRGSSRLVRAIAWSCDGKLVATGTESKGVRVWHSAETLDVASTFTLPSSSKPSPHNGHVASLQFSPVDPHLLVSGCKASPAGGIIAIWDIHSPSHPVQTFKVKGDVLHIAFHPSGRHFAVVCPRQSRDEVFFYWKVLREGKETWEIRDDIGMGGPHIDIGSEEINSLCFLRNGRAVCAVSNDGSLNAWSYPVDQRAYQPPEPGPGEMSGPSTSPTSPIGEHDDGALAAAKSRAPSPTARSRDGEEDDEDGDATEEANGKGPADEASGDQTMAEQNADSEAAPESGAGADDLDDTTIVNPSAAERDDGDIEMTEGVLAGDGAEGGEAKIAVTQNQTQSQEPSEPSADIPMQESHAEENAQPPKTDESAAAVPTPTRPMKAVDPELEAEKLRARQLTRIRHSMVHSASLLALAFDPSGRFLAVGGQDAMLSIMTTRDWICVRTIDTCTAAIRVCAFSPDGELVAMGGDDSAIYISSVFTGQTVAKVPVHGTVNSLVWHASKNWLAFSTSAKTASPVWYVVQSE